MKPLSPEAQAIVDAARAGDVPAVEDRMRIKQSVLVRVSAAAVAISSASATSSVAAAKGGVAWLVTSLVVGGAAAIGVVQWNDTHRPATAPLTARAAEPAPRERTESKRVPTSEESPDVPAPTAPLRVAPSRPPDPAAAPSRVASHTTLEREIALLREAHEALRAAEPGRALDVLDQHAERFPRGALAEERRAVRAIALCQAKPGSAARAQAETFLRSAPESPLVERVRSACDVGPPEFSR
ncbi:MAG TPA: hypothetical protein VF881_08615 [Polyangiaceae bacterium]